MIGFRKVELVQDETGNGRNFYFAVNKVPIFAKGSTLVPVSIFPEDIDNATTLKRIITDAVDSNMNMIRVWGGGTYLSDKFYELADKEGILIWQDFMFTSALYPSDENFLNNVLGEVNYQVKRIFSHPCLAIFSANFEIEQAFASNWYNISNRREYANDYRQLFVKTIKKEFDRLTNNSKNFVYSSPSNGIRTENERYLSSNPNSEFYGDFHYLEQNKNPLNYIKYPIPRFVSAFGVQSLPSAESLLKQADNKKSSNLQANNQFLTHRQHMSSNFDQMREHIEYLLDLPPDNALGVDQTFIFYSQIVQAFSLKLQIEHYRKYKSYLLADGRGNTMGALYWQMNDVWSAPSLSGIDYYGKWKMAQYTIKDAFSPVIIAGTITDNTLEVFVISDLTKTVYDATAKIIVYNWNSFKPLFEETVPVVLLSLKAQQIYTTEVKELFESLNCTLKDCFFYMQLEKAEDDLAPENYVFPNNSRGADIPHHTINVTSVTQLPYKNIFEVQITSKYVSTFVWLDSHDLDGKFSENGFLMVKPQRTVYFFPDKKVTIEEVKKSIDVVHSHDPIVMPSGSFSIQNTAYYLIIIIAFLHVTNILL